MSKLGPDDKQMIRQLHLAGRGVGEIHAALGGRVSTGHIYRVTRPMRLADGSARTNGRRGSKPAADRLDAEVLRELFALIYHRNRTAEQAVADLVANGRIAAADAPHPGTVSRWLRAMNLTRAQANGRRRGPRVTGRFERATANSLHQFDATRMALFHIDARGDIFYEPDTPAKRARRDAGKTPVIVFGLIDDHSRACYLRAYDGETVPNWFSFLHHAWSRKSRPDQFPFWGLPGEGYTDNASAVSQSYAGRRIFHSGLLGTRLITHVPYQAWSKGKVERLMRKINVEETGLRRAQFEGFDDLNLWLEKVARFFNCRRHGTTGEMPFARWLRSVETAEVTLREPPDWETWSRWLLREFSATVSAHCEVRCDGEVLRLPQVPPFKDMAGRRVTVLMRPRCEDDWILIDGDVEWSLPRTPARLAEWLNQYRDRRTTGEIVRDGTADVPLDHIDHAARLDAGLLEGFDAPTSGAPFRLPAAAAAQAALSAALAAEPLSRRQVIARLRTASIVGDPLSDGDAALVDRVMSGGASIEAGDLDRWIADLTPDARATG